MNLKCTTISKIQEGCLGVMWNFTPGQPYMPEKVLELKGSIHKDGKYQDTGAAVQARQQVRGNVSIW